MSEQIEQLDRIEIKDLLLRCIIGLNAEERRARQDVVINVVLYADLAAAAKRDDVDATVNYRTVTKRIIEHVEGSSYYLLETLVDRVAQLCLEAERVRRVEVSIEKPGALRFARSVGVRMVRTREDYPE